MPSANIHAGFQPMIPLIASLPMRQQLYQFGSRQTNLKGHMDDYIATVSKVQPKEETRGKQLTRIPIRRGQRLGLAAKDLA